MIGRRHFIGCVGAFPILGTAWAAEGTPLLRIGVMTDTHVKETKASCRRVKMACELFRRHRVDMVVNVGDVADYHYPKGYAAYRAVVEKAFDDVPPAERPKELFVYAAHDTFAWGGHKARSEWPKHIDEAFADMQRLIGAENGPYASGSVKGIPYVTFPQTTTNGLDWKRIEVMISEASRANPGKPVFVFAHVPPEGTTRTGRGDPRKTALFSKHPQVVNISGHVHGSLADERAIWQGAFTSVSAGCLQNWGDGRDGIVGNNVPRMQNYGVMIVEVFSSRIVFRRFDVREGEEYHAEAPWTVPWPFDAATAPYRHAMCSMKAGVPSFAADAVLGVSTGSGGPDGVVLSMPTAVGEPRPFMYRVRLDRKGDDGKWTAHARRDFFGDFWQTARERPSDYSLGFAGAYFDAGRTYRFRVSPVSAWGVEGRALAAEFVAAAPTKPPRVVWQTDDAMKDCLFKPGLSGGVALPQDGGFFEMGRRDARLEFPKGVWKGPKGARFRFSIDVHAVQGGWPTWTIVLRNPDPMKNAFNRVSTPDGDAGMLRYVFDFAKVGDADSYYLLVREGGEGKIRFGRIVVERLD